MVGHLMEMNCHIAHSVKLMESYALMFGASLLMEEMKNNSQKIEVLMMVPNMILMEKEFGSTVQELD